MPWKERSIVEERMRFVLRLKDGESMASLCREFGISRVTGYKIYERYKECGLEGLTDLRASSSSSGVSGFDSSKMSDASSRESRCSTAILSESSSRLLKAHLPSCDFPGTLAFVSNSVRPGTIRGCPQMSRFRESL